MHVRTYSEEILHGLDADCSWPQTCSQEGAEGAGCWLSASFFEVVSSSGYLIDSAVMSSRYGFMQSPSGTIGFFLC